MVAPATGQLARLGDFKFTQKQSDVHGVDKTSNYAFERINRPAASPLFEATGKHDVTLNISGEILMPASEQPLQLLYEMAASKQPQPLTIGSVTEGQWIVTSINETRSELNADGSPRRVSFRISLQKVEQ